MFELFGTTREVYQDKIGKPFLDMFDESVVAIFDEEKDALKYNWKYFI